MGMFHNVARQDVGATLKLTPSVKDNQLVALELELTIEDIRSMDQVKGPTTSKRKLKTTVHVPDGDVVVLGGLSDTKNIKDVDKVPLAGDIPVIGNLFRYVSKNIREGRLIFLVRPIVKHPGELELPPAGTGAFK